MENATRNLQTAPIILAGQANYDSVEPITRKDYYSFEYFRLWWPNQDYFNLTFDRIVNILKSADMRQAVFDIWYARDYSLYAELNNNSYLDVSTWLPSQKMRMYIRKDVAEELWDFISEDALLQSPAGDAFASITTTISPTQFIGGDEVLNEPRGIDIAPDGSIYVADSKNNQIKHFSTTGILLDAWGSFGSITDDSAGAVGSTFYEPWDVAVSSDGTVYVADTWNHRIQKFTADGQFISMWGYFATDNTPLAYWGPRGITVDADGNVYFADTGNKRIMVFDKDNNFLAQIGTGGSDFGQFNEPVGIALDENNNLYVADTWNARVQVIVPDLELNTSTPLMSWNVEGWYGESTNNKPFIAVNAEGNVFVTDPEGSLILEYSASGVLLHAWDIRGLLDETITMPVDIEFADDGSMWVSDAASNMIYGYTISGKEEVEQVETAEVSPTQDTTLLKESQLELLHTKTHQEFINAAYEAAEELGISPWELLRAAGWGNFTDERGALYSGEHIMDITTLSDTQKEALLKYLGIINMGE
jgi:DNA-binding beta-propeller fold protein YncE